MGRRPDSTASEIVLAVVGNRSTMKAYRANDWLLYACQSLCKRIAVQAVLSGSMQD